MIITISLDIKKSVIICANLWTKKEVCGQKSQWIKIKSVDNMRLSKNFTMEELCRSATAERYGIRNWPAEGDEEHRVRRI